MRLTEERRQEGRGRKEEGTFCKLEICTLRLAKAKATEWKENGEGLTQTDANVEEEIVINEGKQLHEITDAIAPLLAADAHPHIPHSLTASPNPQPHCQWHFPLQLQPQSLVPPALDRNAIRGHQRFQLIVSLPTQPEFLAAIVKSPPSPQHTSALALLILHLLPLCVLCTPCVFGA